MPNIAYFCAMVLRTHCTGHCSGLYGKYGIPVRGGGGLRWIVWVAPRRRSAEKAAPGRRSAQKAAPRRRTGTFAAPRWCPATEHEPCRRRAVGAGATLASGGRGEATYVHLSPTGLHVWPREGSWTVGGRGGPGLTQGRRTRNRDVSRLVSSVAVRVGNPSHSYHPEGF